MWLTFFRLVLRNGHSHVLLTLEISVMMSLNRSKQVNGVKIQDLTLYPGNSLAIQWLGLDLSLPVPRLNPMVRELRSLTLHGAAKNLLK